MPEMKCPVCGLVLEPQEVYDGHYDSEAHEEEWYGRCPKCGKQYCWTVVFVYKEVKNFHEDEEDE